MQAGKRKRGKGEIAEERTSSLIESVSGAAENIRRTVAPGGAESCQTIWGESFCFNCGVMTGHDPTVDCILANERSFP